MRTEVFLRAVSSTVSLATMLLMFATPSLCADERDRMLADWQKRFERVQTVRYTITGTEEANTEYMTEKIRAIQKRKGIPTNTTPALPPGSTVQSVKKVILIDLVKKRFRVESSRQVPSKSRDRYVSEFTVSAFDGKAFQNAIPRDQNDKYPEEADIGIVSGNLDKIRMDPFLWPVFTAHGIVPTVNEELHPDHFPVKHELDEFEYFYCIAQFRCSSRRGGKRLRCFQW